MWTHVVAKKMKSQTNGFDPARPFWAQINSQVFPVNLLGENFMIWWPVNESLTSTCRILKVQKGFGENCLFKQTNKQMQNDSIRVTSPGDMKWLSWKTTAVTLASRKLGWWLNQPIWKIWANLGSFFSRDRGEDQTYLSCHHLETSLTGQIGNISPTIHQPMFPWNKGMSLTFHHHFGGNRSCENWL